MQRSPVSYFPEISGSYRYRIIRCGIHGSQTSPVKASGCLFCLQDLVDRYVKRAQIGDTIKVCYLKEDSDISNGVIAVYEIIPLEENKQSTIL